MSEPPRREPRTWARWRRLIVKAAVTVAGFAVLGVGLIMMVTPGPGLLGVAAGLAILATEWEWAERWLGAARRKVERARAATLGSDPGPRRRRWRTAGGAVLAAVATGVAALLVVPDLLGG